MKCIGVLTSGGDAPGMNAAIRSVVRTGCYYDLQMKGILYGYQGLMENQVVPLDVRSVGDIIQRGGTMLKTSRSEAFKTESGRQQAYQVMKEHRMDGLVVIGGGGTLQGALKMTEEGVAVIGIPGTIDNDIPGTQYTIGFDTAVNTVLEAMNKIRDTATSHERIFIIEVMGRDCGQIALQAGLAGGAEAILLPEVEPDIEKIANSLQKSIDKGKKFSILVVSEGVMSGAQLQKELKDKAGLHTWVTVLGHTQRGGSPSAYDRLLAAYMGVAAVEGLMADKSGTMVTWNCHQIGFQKLSELFATEPEFDWGNYRLAARLSL